MRIAICDDKALDRALIMDLLQQYLEDRSIRCELTGYEDGVTLICDMEDGLWFDAVFLDIYMREPPQRGEDLEAHGPAHP